MSETAKIVAEHWNVRPVRQYTDPDIPDQERYRAGMAIPDRAPSDKAQSYDEAHCWQCGAIAATATGCDLLLVADPRFGLSGYGYLVKRGARQDEVRVRVPRCGRCRQRSGVSIAFVFTCAGLGAVAGRALPLPADWHASPPGGSAGLAIGLVAGFVAAMLALALYRHLAGIRAVTTYPPVVRLRREGWHFPYRPGD
ncbi:MAG TPA: hypothetical protein VME47_24565 [Acetobacteraceae bacterium]|nr:hypothetical protein [Acetobacteraceae bacterium]